MNWDWVNWDWVNWDWVATDLDGDRRNRRVRHRGAGHRRRHRRHLHRPHRSPRRPSWIHLYRCCACNIIQTGMKSASNPALPDTHTTIIIKGRENNWKRNLRGIKVGQIPAAVAVRVRHIAAHRRGGAGRPAGTGQGHAVTDTDTAASADDAAADTPAAGASATATAPHQRRLR